jgi:hypothetical protein
MSNPLVRNLILTHWRTYHPKMVAEMERENRLDEAVSSTAEQFTELMYTLVVEQGMDYSAAKEIAIDQFLLPEEADESDPTNQNRQNNPPATSE